MIDFNEYTKPPKDLIIVRGLPGSGKSTVAELIGGEICTADDYFMVNGVYKFYKSKLGEAHHYCQTKCRLKMANASPKIVVANTSSTEKEMRPYFELAKEFGYRVFTVIVEKRHGGNNIHSVPEETISRMRLRFDIKL